MPLWGSGRGISYLYDSASARVYALDYANSSYWRDLVDYRDMSVQEYMNTIAGALQKNIADVPVIFKCPKYHRIYANPFGMGGYDGLGIEAYGTGDGPAVRVGGRGVFAGRGVQQVHVADGLPALRRLLRAPRTRHIPGRASLVGSLDCLREVGCKGFYVDGHRTRRRPGRLAQGVQGQDQTVGPGEFPAHGHQLPHESPDRRLCQAPRSRHMVAAHPAHRQDQ